MIKVQANSVSGEDPFPSLWFGFCPQIPLPYVNMSSGPPSGNFPGIWELNNILLNSPQITFEAKREIS